MQDKTKYQDWKCDGCGEVLRGIRDSDGSFVSDKEIETQPVAGLRAEGCYLCGCPGGEFLGPSYDPDDA